MGWGTGPGPDFQLLQPQPQPQPRCCARTRPLQGRTELASHSFPRAGQQKEKLAGVRARIVVKFGPQGPGGGVLGAVEQGGCTAR